MIRKNRKEFNRRLSHKIKQKSCCSVDMFWIHVSQLVHEDVLIFPDDDYDVSFRNRKLTITNTKTTEMGSSRFRRELRKVMRQVENADHRFVITKNGKREFVFIGIVLSLKN